MPNVEANSDPRYLERRMEFAEAALNITPPSYGGAETQQYATAQNLTALASGAIGTVQVTVAHGLAFIPKIYGIVMTTAGIIFSSAAADATNVYLTADAASRQATITLGR